MWRSLRDRNILTHAQCRSMGMSLWEVHKRTSSKPRSAHITPQPSLEPLLRYSILGSFARSFRIQQTLGLGFKRTRSVSNAVCFKHVKYLTTSAAIFVLLCTSLHQAHILYTLWSMWSYMSRQNFDIGLILIFLWWYKLLAVNLLT